MKITNFQKVDAQEVNDAGAKGVTIRWLISKDVGAPNFAMRLFEIKPEGNTPFHKHNWEHEVFILEGKGSLVTEQGDFPLNKGDAVLVPGEEKHQFRNASDRNLVFLCLVPIEK